MRLADDIRAGEWWAHKLAPLLGVGYAAAYVDGQDLTSAAGPLVVALLLLTAGSAYVSLLNDLTDREVDARAGKRNRAAERGRDRSVLLLGVSVAAGWVPALALWWDDPWLLAIYAAPWLAFTAYSAPPLRLKERGLPGALADGAGAELLPRLFVVAVVVGPAWRAEQLWVALLLLWGAALGLRGAVLHQLHDLDGDVGSGVHTFAARHPRGARLVGTRLAFPVEVSAFAALVLATGNPWAIAVVPLYAAFELLCVRRLGKHLLIVGPPGDGPHRVAAQELYVVLFPLAYLAACALRAPADVAVLAAHLVLFHAPIRAMAREARDLLYVLRRDVSPSLVRR